MAFRTSRHVVSSGTFKFSLEILACKVIRIMELLLWCNSLYFAQVSISLSIPKCGNILAINIPSH